MTDYHIGAMSSVSPPSSAILLSGTRACSGLGSGPAFLPLFGRTILEWQAQAVRSANIGKLLLIGDTLPEPLASRIADGVIVERVTDPAALAPMLSGSVLLLAEGLLLDARAVRGFVADAGQAAPALLVFGADAPPQAERIDRDCHWAGAALLPADMIVGIVADLGDWDLASTLLRVADAAGARRIVLETLDRGEPADPDRRLADPLAWAMPADADAVLAQERHLLAAAVPVGPDLADRYLYWPVARRLAVPLSGVAGYGTGLRWLGLLLALLALPAFLLHFWWVALGLLLLAPLANQTGRILIMARSEMSQRRMPTEAVHTVLTAVAIAGLAVSLPPAAAMAPLLAGAGLVFLTSLRAVRLAWYARRVGAHLDLRSSADHLVVSLMGPASSMPLPLLPLAIAGLWWPGVLALLAWSAVLLLLLEWRFCLAMDAALPARPR